MFKNSLCMTIKEEKDIIDRFKRIQDFAEPKNYAFQQKMRCKYADKLVSSSSYYY